MFNQEEISRASHFGIQYGYYLSANDLNNRCDMYPISRKIEEC